MKISFKISGLTLSVSEPELFPTVFLESLNGFLVAEGVEEPDINLAVEHGSPEEGCAVFTSTLVHIQPTDDGGSLFYFSDGTAKCALSFRLKDGSAKLYIYEGTELSDPDLTEQARVLLRMVFEEAGAYKGVLSLHSSAFVHRGTAVCVTGPSGAGKSTLTKNWLSAVDDSFVLNGDRPILLDQGDGITVFGAPWSGTENIFINKQAPLRAIVEVRRHCQNRITLLSKEKAFRLLLKRISMPVWNREAVGFVIDSISRLVEDIQVYRFYCVNDISAGEELYKALYGSEEYPAAPEGENDLKIKSDFVLRKILDNYVVVPVGADSAAGGGAIMLDEVGAFIWENLKHSTTREALLDNILREFDVDRERASKDLDEFLDVLLGAKALDEE